MGRKLRITGGVAAGLLFMLLGYWLAGTVGGLIPSNSGWRPSAQGVTIYVEDNGIHTGIVMPKVAAGVDWRPLAPPRDLVDPRYGAHPYVAIGWGERDFYLNTPTWWDVRPSTIAGAMFGSDATLMHVEHVARPVTGGNVRALVVTEGQYRRLASYIRASFAPRGARYRGYAQYDAFYTGRGHYSGVATCNAWTGDALRHAGIRVGAWTPFASGVMRWF